MFFHTHTGVRSYTSEEVESMRNRTGKYEEEEAARVLRDKLVNDMESFIYSTRDRITDDDIERHSTQDERDELESKLNQASEWLENEVDEANTTEIKKKFHDLKDSFKTLEKRGQLFKELPQSFELCRRTLESTEKSLVNISEYRMVNETDVEEVTQSIEETKSYLKEWEIKLKNQDQKAHPVIQPIDITLRCDMAKALARKVLYAPKRIKVENTQPPKTEKSEPEEKAAEDAEKASTEEVVQ